ncbi:MAG: glutamine amidotransferase family protein [Hyphomicrobium denitrificans]|uniref:glutamine--fructose-6-phosphate transaminase (isomerizing) n=1 Tax=Hyphomicrobium denitrificans (strain ATCC 51888 / DSM 1869 / NCIMB 11706 / TK 0415) TaxID=582899 RepID=D8JS74_HYPDA|nr:glutamine amidotransferase family protein [Hyphomicrobium denitrificans]ADJ22333.1 glutamine amidotransferase class-II [Hyphomicrobium denitrificans ATCC 51888]MBN9290666.1 glutamine amidotransferase family protein [Hyphomicrobium denitrificans]
MCGIVGLFLKNQALEPQLGSLVSGMLTTMCERGPDSAGFAVYGTPSKGKGKITIQSADADAFKGLAERIKKEAGVSADLSLKSSHAVLTVPSDKSDAVVTWLRANTPNIRIMGSGEAIEIYKEVGYPTDVAKRFDLAKMSGSHAIGHTRMATESAVTTLGAHPFSTGPDQCLVHNGSLSNHASLRRELRRDGIRFETENDTEVAAAYITWRMKQGLNLGDALRGTLDDLDGFFNFVVGTKNGFGVVRDPIACKPAVMAETDDYVAFGSEYRALVDLPNIDKAHVWEPEPATVYFWER